MYFTNLTNTELEHFKGVKIHPMKLQANANSTYGHLFLVDSTDAYFRKRTLFNCDKIIGDESTIPLENKGFIYDRSYGSLEDGIRYIRFLNDDDDDQEITYQQARYPLTYFDVGDTMSDEEFNAFVQLIKHGKSFVDNVELDKPSTYKYGNYALDIKGQVIDKGILVTAQTLSSSNYITLTGNLFENSSYDLSLRVMTISDVNLVDVFENISYKSITIHLTPGVPALIPLTDLDENDVILFDAEVEINHDKPVIRWSKSLDLTLSGSGYVGDAHTVSVEFTENGTALSGKTIKFYEGSTLIDTVTTDNEGKASVTYTPSTYRPYTFKAVCELYNLESNTVTKQMVYKTPTITVAGKTSVKYGESSTLTGIVSYDGTPLSGKTVKLFDGTYQQTTTTTNADGEYSFNLSNTTTIGNHNYTVEVQTSSPYGEAKANIVVNVRKVNTVFNATCNRSATANTFTLAGTLKDEDGNNMANTAISVIVEYGDVSYVVMGDSTNSSGQFSINETIPNYNGVAKLTLRYAGSSHYAEVLKEFNIVSKINTHFTDITRTQVTGGYAYNGRLLDEDNNPIINKNVIGTIGSDSQSILTGTDGGFVFVRSTSTSFSVVFEEDDTYIGCTGAL